MITDNRDPTNMLGIPTSHSVTSLYSFCHVCSRSWARYPCLGLHPPHRGSVHRNSRKHHADTHTSSPICLSSLSSSPLPVHPEPAHLARQRNLSPAGSDESFSCRAMDTRRDSGILVLNQCHHAFHASCLTSWFEYRHYRCPICQTSYSPVKRSRA